MTRVTLYWHGVSKRLEDGQMIFEINDGRPLKLILDPRPTTPLHEPLAEGEYWFVAIGKARLDDKPIPVEHDRRMAVREGRVYDPREAEE